MGTPEEEIFVDPSEKTDLPDIIDDFDLDFNAGSEEVGSCSFFFDCHGHYILDMYASEVLTSHLYCYLKQNITVDSA